MELNEKYISRLLTLAGILNENRIDKLRAQKFPENIINFAINFAKEPAKRAGQCVLFLPLRRTFGGGHGGCVFLFARAISNLVHRRLQSRLHRVRHLVWTDCTEAKSLKVN